MFQNIEIEFWYSRGGEKRKTSFINSYKNDDFQAILESDQKPNIEKFKLSIIPQVKLIIEKLSVKLFYQFKEGNRIFVNGYQSWTDSREFLIDEKMKR